MWKSLVKFLNLNREAARELGDFTPRAWEVLELARQESYRLHHNFTGTEHLLLGFTKLGKGDVVDLLMKMGLDFDSVRVEVEKQTPGGPDQKMFGHPLYTPRLKTVIELAKQEAKRLNHSFVTTEHLMLGLLLEGHGVAAKVIRELGGGHQIKQLRDDILKELDPDYLPSPANEAEPLHAQISSGPYFAPGSSEANFTPRAQDIMLLARQEAAQRNHLFLGTEHLLFGLIRLLQRNVGNKLQLMNVDFERARVEVEKYLANGHAPNVVGSIPFAPCLTKVIALARQETNQLGHTFIGVEHLVLGLLREVEGKAAAVFRTLDVDIEHARKEILKEFRAE